ncbi:MAG: hypothetical protein ACRBF0_19300 [Calditrichia bacterium]
MPVIYYTGMQPYSKWWLSALLLPCALYLLSDRNAFTILGYADLIIHEAGHFFFSFFGEFMHFLGGTLMQLIFPILLIVHFFINGYRTAVQLFVFWLGQNLINISVYVADAPYQRLQLLGNGRHDWAYMLGRLDLISSAELLGNMIWWSSFPVLVGSLFIPLIMENEAIGKE